MASVHIEDGPISLKSLRDFLVVKISENERMQTAIIHKHNNESVMWWIENIVKKYLLNSKGDVLSLKTAQVSWLLYYEGTSLLKQRELEESGFVVSYPDEVIMKWVKFFEETPVEELCKYGAGPISYGWTIIEKYLQLHFTKYILANFYLKYGSPDGWEQHRAEHGKLSESYSHPFWDPETLHKLRSRIIPVYTTTVGMGKK